MNILVIGKGGREHALVWKLSQSPRAKKIFCAQATPERPFKLKTSRSTATTSRAWCALSARKTSV